jgi:hypothetical protein
MRLPHSRCAQPLIWLVAWDSGFANSILVILRLGQVACGAVVLGILGHFFSVVDDAGVLDPSARLVYTAVIAGLTVMIAVVFIVRFVYSFWSFPLAFFLFAAWLVAFCVCETVSQLERLCVFRL